METELCCAHNVTRGCSVSSKVAVVDLALKPLKALKMLMDGLAIDGVSSLWLRSLLGPPLMMHLFPFDFVYLDEDLRIVEGVELFPNMPFPKCDRGVVSALILPLRTLASTGTQKGDQLILCSAGKLESQLAEIAAQDDPAPMEPSDDLDPVTVSAIEETGEATFIPLPRPDPLPAARPVPSASPVFDHRIPVRTSTVSPGAGFTVSLATTWQITRTTTPPAVLPETQENVAAATPATVVEDPVAETENPATATKADVDALACEPCAAVEQIDNSAPVDLPVSLPQQHDVITVSDLTGNQFLEAIAAAEAAETAASSQVSPAATEERITDQRIAKSREAWEKAQVKPAHPPAQNAARTKKKIQEQKKDPLGTRVIRWLNLEEPPPERRQIIRLRLEGLEAYDANGDRTKRYEMRDVCPTGFCLRARGEWKPGQRISLMILKKGAAEKDHEHRVRVQARVMRCEEDGVGLEFVFPKGTEFQPWKRVKTKRSDETEAVFILRELRLSNALGFLLGLCPGAAKEVQHALHDRLSNKRVASAVDIALLAEDALTTNQQVNLAAAHTDMVMRIIEGGSWIEDGWIRKLWAGLLVSSCTADGQDTSNQPFIDLLAKLTPLHLRILSFVGSKAVEGIATSQSAKDFYLDCTAEELMAASDSHSFTRIQQTIGHLSTCGLFAETARPSYVTLSDKSRTRIELTALGLKMWARCNGQRA
ncbi:MAG TPA: PilZ domain-containing protein [Terracidiphilus sp.]